MEALTENCERQIREILQVVVAFAEGNFDLKADVNGETDLINALANGINMLGDELNHSTISLKEKEVLLREIHHRVKNNLQIVSSILNLQANFSDDEYVKTQFKECQTRISSMALVHEKLYRTENLSNVELNDYLYSLSRQLLNSYKDSVIQLRFTASEENHFSHIDQLLPIGLMINEIISNSLKYAFEEEKGGIIDVRVITLDDGYCIEVEDNGKGMKFSSFDESKTLGMQLVESLAAQIDAELDLKVENGVKYKITINTQRLNQKQDAEILNS